MRSCFSTSSNSPFFVFLLLGLFQASVLVSFSSQAWGSACCARSAAAPFLILTDDEAQVNFGVSAVDSVAQVKDSVVFNRPGVSDFTSRFRLDGALLASDRWQLGLSVAFVSRAVATSPSDAPVTSLGWGDTSVSVAYEVLPNWSYSSWKPQGFLFSVLSLPTGKSKWEEWSSPGEVTGLGFYSATLGGILLKRWTLWDVFTIGEIHYSLSRTFQSTFGPKTVIPGAGGSLGMGVGWSPGGGALRLGIRLQPRIDPLPGLPGQWISNCDTGLDLSYMIGNTQSLMLAYTDQTLLGYAANTNLTRALALNFQHRWER